MIKKNMAEDKMFPKKKMKKFVKKKTSQEKNEPRKKEEKEKKKKLSRSSSSHPLMFKKCASLFHSGTKSEITFGYTCGRK